MKNLLVTTMALGAVFVLGASQSAGATAATQLEAPTNNQAQIILAHGGHGGGGGHGHGGGHHHGYGHHGYGGYGRGYGGYGGGYGGGWYDGDPGFYDPGLQIGPLRIF